MVDVCEMTPAHVGMVRGLLNEYMTWVRTMEHAAPGAPTFEGVDDEIDNLPGPYAPPKGRVLVAMLDDLVCGCVAMKPVDDSTCELKRLYVRPAARRHGAARALVQQFIHEAKSAGYKRIILDSHKSMTGAHAVYRTAGFKEIATPPDFPASLKDEVVFMEKIVV